MLSPNALGAILDEQTIAALKVPVVAGGANNQLATPEDGARLHARGILYAPDYVINAGGIINVCTEYLGDGDASLVRQRIEGIPVGSSRSGPRARPSGRDPAAVADAMAQRLIGRVIVIASEAATQDALDCTRSLLAMTTVAAHACARQSGALPAHRPAGDGLAAARSGWCSRSPGWSRA